jgi:hypothetical protein
MAYRQTPGRGPMATFKNVSSFLGPTVTEGEKERGKEKVTRESKTDVNPETGMKRLTITTTKEGGSGGGTSYILAMCFLIKEVWFSKKSYNK